MSIDQNCDGLLSRVHAPDGILRLTLNDPKRLNALSEVMLMSLGSAIDQAVDNPSVRVIVLAAVGRFFALVMI